MRGILYWILPRNDDGRCEDLGRVFDEQASEDECNIFILLILQGRFPRHSRVCATGLYFHFCQERGWLG